MIYTMFEKRAKVKNKLGIHARPAALLVQAAAKFTSEITLEKDGLSINGKSIMGVMMLAAEVDSVITVRVEGEDARNALDHIVEMIESKFD